MSDVCLDYDFGCFEKEKETSRTFRTWKTGDEKEEIRRILDDDRDVILHRPAPDEGLAPDEKDLKEHEQSKKLATSNEDYVDLVEKGPVLETSGGNATKFSCTSEKSDRRRRKAKIQILFISTVFYGITRAQFLSVRLILLLLMFGNVIGPEMKSLDECCIQITDYKFETDLVLECICRSNECTGTKQWTGGPMGTTLALNSHVSVGMESKIRILEQNSFNYTILIKNATIDDWSSNYKCNFGTLSKQISLDGYDQKSTSAVSSFTSTHCPDDCNNDSTPATTTVSSITSIHGQDDGNNEGGLSDGAIAGIAIACIVGVIVVAVVVCICVCICRKSFECCRCQSPSKEEEPQADNELLYIVVQ